MSPTGQLLSIVQTDVLAIKASKPHVNTDPHHMLSSLNVWLPGALRRCKPCQVLVALVYSLHIFPRLHLQYLEWRVCEHVPNHISDAFHFSATRQA